LSTRAPKAPYRIFETRQFQKDLGQIAKAGHAEIAGKLREIVYPQLRRSPHFGPNVRKLKGYSPETWRYRIGAWRFFYEIDEDEAIVLMIAASHRGSAY
jgi:mRNA interferase RelE/StbE